MLNIPIELTFVCTLVSTKAKNKTPTKNTITYANIEDCTAFLTYPFNRSLPYNVLLRESKLIKPYSMILAITAPINAEYLASGPNVSTARDSICPGVSENKVCDAISGRNDPPTSNLISNEIATAIAPATSPVKNNLFLVIAGPDVWLTRLP